MQSLYPSYYVSCKIIVIHGSAQVFAKEKRTEHVWFWIWTPQRQFQSAEFKERSCKYVLCSLEIAIWECERDGCHNFPYSWTGREGGENIEIYLRECDLKKLLISRSTMIHTFYTRTRRRKPLLLLGKWATRDQIQEAAAPALSLQTLLYWTDEAALRRRVFLPGRHSTLFQRKPSLVHIFWIFWNKRWNQFLCLWMRRVLMGRVLGQVSSSKLILFKYYFNYVLLYYILIFIYFLISDANSGVASTYYASFPVDVIVYFHMQPSTFRFSCQPVSRVECMLRLPSLDIVFSSKRAEEKHE